jgi:hypothetical protein
MYHRGHARQPQHQSGSAGCRGAEAPRNPETAWKALRVGLERGTMQGSIGGVDAELVQCGARRRALDDFEAAHGDIPELLDRSKRELVDRLGRDGVTVR